MSTITSGTSGITFPDGSVQSIAAPSAGGVIFVNGQTITSNYTFTAGTSGLSAGPVSLSGSVVTMPTGTRWVIV